MKVELNDSDLKQIADIVTENIRKGVIQTAAHESHYMAMIETGKEMALRLYGDIDRNDGVYQILESKLGELCKEELRFIIKTELENLIGDNEALQKMLFGYLLEGVVGKAKNLVDQFKYDYDEEEY